MNSPHINGKGCYPAIPIILGLLCAQIIATAQVYYDNISLHRTLTGIQKAGLNKIPNEQMVPALQQLSTALCGGLFFTLTTGAGISLFSFAAAWIWDRMFRRNPTFLFFLIFLLMAFLAAVNLKGFSPFESLYFILIPPVVFAGTLLWMPRENRKKGLQKGIIQVLCLALLGFLWVPQMTEDLFINIRDRLLLNNPLGQGIVDFYYQYSPYAEAVMKKYSILAEHHHFFRRFTFYSLLIGFPVTLYMLWYSLAFLFLGRFFSRKIAWMLSLGVCLITGILLLIPMLREP